jgi:hypothetical protein
MLPLKYRTFLHAKNLLGWSTRKRIVVFSVDDYGNIRVASKQARSNLQQAGLNLDKNRFDQYDTLETADDLTQLYESLNIVKDVHGKPAVFTAFALPANIDFTGMHTSRQYRYQLLPETLQTTQGHEGTWALWQQGIRERLLVPQYHGREHVNLSFLRQALAKGDQKVLACLHEHSWAGLDSRSYPNVNYVSAFSFNSFSENAALREIALDGLNAFQKVFGFKAENFNAPGSPAHSFLEESLREGGIKYIDTAFIKKEHQGNGKFKYKFAYQGKKNNSGQRYLIRNCVFEPLLDRNSGPVARTLQEIEIAFRLNKPAIISSHRVNFCGKIDTDVRSFGLSELRNLLKEITKRWPNVEFMTANELGDEMSKTN